jgi:hypothetical protein
LLLSILAVIPAVLIPLAAISQTTTSDSPDRPERSEIVRSTQDDAGAQSDGHSRRHRGWLHFSHAEALSKYEVFAGYGYTSLNQVDNSRHGLQGVEIAVTRDWGKYFGLTADGADYWSPLNSENLGTTPPYKPTVSVILGGPVVHANLSRHIGGFVHVLLGGEHTGGAYMTNSLSFADGYGGGLDYAVTNRLALRASGDDIRSSFQSDPNHLGLSPHERSNSRASIGVVYKF